MNTPPYVLQSGSHSAQLFRQAISTLLASAGGVVGANDLLVTQNGTPNMSVNVAGGPPGSGGGIWVPGTTSAGVQGQYFGYQDATVNLAIAAANATNPRIDVVMVQVQDAAYAGAVNSITLSVLTGTPAASPVAPTLPASSLALANILVPAASTSVVTGNITDKRSAYRLRSTSAVRGSVSGAGAVTAGSGFTAAKVGTGQYTVTFSPTLVSVPAVVLTAGPIPAAINATLLNALPVTATSFSVGTVALSAGTTTALDSPFQFIAIPS